MSETNEHDAQALLRTGLAAQHRELYMTNAWFRASVDAFAQMLPVFVDGIAANATDRQAENDEAYRKLLLAAPQQPMSEESGGDEA